MKISRKLPLIAAPVLLALAGCAGGSNAPKPGHVEIVCDATVENIMDQEIDVFEYTYNVKQRRASVIPYYVNQEAAFDSLLTADNDISTIVVGRKLTDAERTRLRNRKLKPREEKIAIDAVALIVNNANDIPELSMSELRDILTGKVQNWNDIYPSHLDTIRVVFDENGSSLLQYMRDRVTGGEPFGKNVYAQHSSAEVFEAVNNLRGSIGIIGVSWLSTDMEGTALSRDEMRRRSQESDTAVMSFNPAVRVLALREDDSLEAYKPYQAYIYDGRYPLHRPIYMITTTVGGTVNNAFFSFVTSPQGQKVILLTGVLPAKINPRVVQLSD